ncbi:rhomboid family intramembrane serine protease [bacterium]|nr:rhomboid family intramembrane serine protease [bacterium]
MPFVYSYGLPKAIKSLLITNAVIFVITNLFIPSGLWSALFGLTPLYILKKFWIWQFFTYMFLHGDFWHIGFNMFALWMFGSELEYNWGTRDFLKYYFTCGIGGGLLVLITSLIGFSNPYATTIGASGAIFGLLLAYGMMWPDRLILVFGILPMKALQFVILFGAIDLVMGLSRSNTKIAYFAHVGGFVTGFIYLKYGWRVMINLESIWKHNAVSRWWRRRKFTVIDGGRGKSDEDGGDDQSHPDLDEEVNRILDKIARHGMDSLSDNERRILDRASQRKR